MKNEKLLSDIDETRFLLDLYINVNKDKVKVRKNFLDFLQGLLQRCEEVIKDDTPEGWVAVGKVDDSYKEKQFNRVMDKMETWLNQQLNKETNS